MAAYLSGYVLAVRENGINYLWISSQNKISGQYKDDKYRCRVYVPFGGE